MRELSHSARRATMDIDMDFLRFPLTDDVIFKFVRSLNVYQSFVKIERKMGKIMA